MERTVGELLPQLKETIEMVRGLELVAAMVRQLIHAPQMSKRVDDLMETYKKRTEDLDTHVRKHGIKAAPSS